MKNTNFEFFGNHRYEIEDPKVPIQRLYDYDTKSSFKRIGSYINSQKKLLRRIKKERPEVVHFQWFKFAVYDYFLLREIKKTGTGIVYTAHNVKPHYGIDRYTGMYGKIYRIVDVIIVHAQRTKEELIDKYQLPENKIQVIPHGILSFEDHDLEKVREYEEKFKKDHQLQDQVVFAMLGEVNYYKGVDVVIDAWKSSALAKSTKMKLILAGKGKYNRLKELDGVENAIVMNRFLENEEFMALLKIADFLLLPYRRISQSGVLLTALHQKKRVIVSNVGGLADPFKFGQIGYVLKKLDRDELSKTIEKACNESNRHPEEKVWEDIFAHFDWKSIAKSTQRVYEAFV